MSSFVLQRLESGICECLSQDNTKGEFLVIKLGVRNIIKNIDDIIAVCVLSRDRKNIFKFINEEDVDNIDAWLS